MGQKRYYIAYGSNLSVEQMGYRCPDAKIIGTAVIDGYALLFKGCATIEPQEGKRVPVLVWEISPSDEESLDRYEGYPSLYYKKEMTLNVRMMGTGEEKKLDAMVYIMDGRRLAAPTGYYYKVLADGYEAFGFDKAVLEQALADSIGECAARAFLGRYREAGKKPLFKWSAWKERQRPERRG